MQRRRFLVGAMAMPPIVAGCLGSGADSGGGGCTGDWNPTIEADEPRIAPGEETVLHVGVTDVMGFSLLIPIHDDDDGVTFGEETVSPPPDRVADTSPAQWFWEACTDVEVEAPVRVDRDARPGDVSYGVHLVRSLDGSGDSRDREYTITVTDA